MNPNFTIIIPTYNRAEFISQTIESVLAQSYNNFELIIVDDGSTDDTEAIIKSIQDNRIKYIHKENEERAVARNYGIALADGDYVTFLDSDDRLYPHYFSEAKKVLNSHENPEWFHLAYEIRDENGKVIRRENNRRGSISESLITGNHLSCIGVFVRRDIIQKINFNEDRQLIGSEDYLLWMCLAAEFPLHYSNRISAYMIQHSERSVLNFNTEKLITRIDKLKHYLFSNTNCKKAYTRQKDKIHAFLDIYLALHLLPDKPKAMTFFSSALKHYPLMVLEKRLYSFLKTLLFG